MSFSFGDIISAGGSAFSAVTGWLAGSSAEKQAGKQANLIREQAKANREISLYDASVAEVDAFMAEQMAGYKLKDHLQKMDKVIGAQRAALGKAGVALGKGSALDVILESAREGAVDAEMIRFSGQTARQRGQSLAQRYRMLAEAGLRDAAAQAALIEEAGASVASGYRWRAAGQALYSLGELGYERGWF